MENIVNELVNILEIKKLDPVSLVEAIKNDMQDDNDRNIADNVLNELNNNYQDYVGTGQHTLTTLFNFRAAYNALTLNLLYNQFLNLTKYIDPACYSNFNKFVKSNIKEVDYYAFETLLKNTIIDIFNTCYNSVSLYVPFKSKRHHPDELDIREDLFICGIISVHLRADKLHTSNTMIGIKFDWSVSNHYFLKDWDLFKVIELDHAPEYNGHNSDTTLEELLVLSNINDCIKIHTN